MNAYALTDVGRQRNTNQDYVYITGKPVGNLPNLYIVADGMGGHKAGDLASRFAVNTFIDYVKASESTKPVTIISEAIKYTNTKVLELAASSPDYTGMGTTFVVVTIYDKSAYIANIGDSRLYIMDRELQQVTRDHSLVEEMIQLGTIKRSEARNHERKNVITRAVGGAESVMPDFFEVELSDNGRIIMCTDGLTNMVTDAEIENVISSGDDIRVKAERLVQMANDNGGKDNISIIIIEP